MKNPTVETMSRKEAEERGIAVFNGGSHTFIDLSEMKLSEDEGMHTISIKLPNGDFVTTCIVPFFTYDGGKSGTVDFKYHNEKAQTTVMGFENGTSKVISADLYTLDYKKGE